MNKKLKNTLFQLILGIFGFSFVNLQAQSEVQNKTIDLKNKLSFTFSPEYAYQSIVSNGNSNSNFWSDSKPISSYSTGFGFMHSFSRKFEIETGLNYSVKGFQIPRIVMTSLDNPDASDPNNLYRVKYKYRYLDIPLKFNTFFNIKKLNCYVSTGAIGNVLLNGDAILIRRNDKSVRQKYNLNLIKGDVSLSGFLGFGMVHVLTPKFLLRTDVHLQHQLFVSNNPPPIERKLYNAGFGISLVYCLKKIEYKTTGTNF